MSELFPLQRSAVRDLWKFGIHRDNMWPSKEHSGHTSGRIASVSTDIPNTRFDTNPPFKLSDVQKTDDFGGLGGKGPSGADWEDIITHHYNVLVGKPGFDPKATEAVEKKWDDFDEIGIKIATNFKKNLSGTGMIQYGAGKSKANLSSFWQNPAKGVKGGTDGTPKENPHNVFLDTKYI